MKPAWALGVLVGAALLAYGNTLQAHFVYDDRPIIVKNPLIRKLDHIPLLFTTSYWGMHTGQPQEYKGTLYRPIPMVTYAFNYAAGKLHPAGYHAVNILLHIGVSLLLWALCLRLGFPPTASAMGAILFAVLPIHTEAVSNIVGRSDVLAAFFVLAAWVLIAKESRPQSILLAALCFALALLSKENAAAFLPVLLFSDFILYRKKKNVLKEERSMVWLVLAGVLFLTLQWRSLILGKALGTGAIPYFSSQSGAVVLLTMAQFTVRRYLTPLLTGTGFGAEYTRPAISDVLPNDPQGWMSVLLLALIIGGALYSLRRSTNLKALAVLIFFGFLAPVSNLFMKMEIIGAERLLYLPSIGYCMLLGLLLSDIARPSSLFSRPTSYLLAALTLWYGWQTFERNKIWRTEEAFWGKTVQEAPNSPRAWNGLGVVRLNQGKYDEAIAHFQKALTLNSFLGDAYFNLGESYYAKGDFKRAKRLFLELSALKPYDRDTLFFLGAIAEQEHDARAAMAYYSKVLRVNPLDRPARRNLALIHCRMGDFALCRKELGNYLLEELPGEQNEDIRRFLEQRPKDR